MSSVTENEVYLSKHQAETKVSLNPEHTFLLPAYISESLVFPSIIGIMTTQKSCFEGLNGIKTGKVPYT